MTRGISQPSSGTCQSTGTDTSIELTQSSTSEQTVDPSQQVQSSEEERNDAVTETSEPNSISESTSSGILGNTGASTSSEDVDGLSQQVPSEERESVGAGEPSRASQSDIPSNTSQSSSSGENVSGKTTQQKLVSKRKRKYVLTNGEDMGSYEAIHRDICRTISQILNRQSEPSETVLQQREQRNMNIISETHGFGYSVRLSEPSTSSEDTAHQFRSNQSEEAHAVIPEGIVSNAVRNLNDGTVDNPALPIPGVTWEDLAFMKRAERNVAAHQAELRRQEEMLDRQDRLETQELSSDDLNSEDRLNDRMTDGVRGRGKQCFRNDIPPKGDGDGGGK